MKLGRGTRIRNFVLSEKLGEGGMGEVWKATLDIVGKSIAVKFILPEKRNPHLEQRFMQEARTMARLDHERIVPLNDFFVIDDVFVLVMPYVQGVPLEHLIDSAPRGLPLPDVTSLSLQILSGLDYAHENKIIHRDIKPSNVLVAQSGKAWLMDFGIAKAVGERRLTQTGSALGTVSYMSPEQILYPDKVDRRADIYSFGVMLYEMLVGCLPFDDPESDSGSTFRIQSAHCTQPPPPLRQWNPSVTPEFEAIVLRALAKKPEDRYQTCAEFARAIQRYGSDRTGRIQPTPTILEVPPAAAPVSIYRPLANEQQKRPTKSYKNWRRLTLLGATAAAFLGLILLFGYNALRNENPSGGNRETSTGGNPSVGKVPTPTSVQGSKGADPNSGATGIPEGFEIESTRETRHLRISCDLPCDWTLDGGRLRGQIESAGSKDLTVSDGVHVVEASVSNDNGIPPQKRRITIYSSKTNEVSFSFSNSVAAKRNRQAEEESQRADARQKIRNQLIEEGLQRADSKFKSGDDVGAIEAYNGVLRLDPGNQTARDGKEQVVKDCRLQEVACDAKH